MSRRRAFGSLTALAAAITVAACTSPEARRVRGGDAGGDPGNRGAVVELHAGAEPYHQTPCLTTVEPCTGPLPRFGLRQVDRGSND